jgi:hypothetical protein
VIANWTLDFSIGLAANPRIAAFLARVAAHPSVYETLGAEGVAGVDLSLIPSLP